MHDGTRPSHRRALPALTAILVVTCGLVAGCGASGGPAGLGGGAAITEAPTSTTMSEAAALADATRLLDPTGTGRETPAEVACVKQTVVDDPNIDELAHNMATYANKDLRQAVMTRYLNCASDFVLDLYMAYAPASLTADQRACIRARYTRLTVARLAEVMVQDPDAGQTGPLLISSCTGNDVGDPFAGIDTVPPTP